MNENPSPVNNIPIIPTGDVTINTSNLTNVNQTSIKENPNPAPSSKKINVSSKVIILIVSVVLIGVMLVGFYIYYQNILIIEDQPLSSAITINRLFLAKGGSLAIDQSDAPSNYLLATGYLTPGLYKDFAIAYQTNTLTNPSPDKSYKARAFIFEDTNNNQKFDSNTDKILKNIFGRPFVKYFKLENIQPKPVLCSSGFSDNFSEQLLDKTRWNAYILNKIENGRLIQTVGDSNSTTLYSKNNFSGNIQVDATIMSFNINPVSSDYKAITELEIFTPFDRVVSVRWNKTATESYLTTQVSKKKEQPQDKIDVPGDGPLKLRIVRQGNVATIYLANPNGDFQQIWQTQDISTEDAAVGLESYNLDGSSNFLTTTLSDFSVVCPSN